LQGKAPIKTWLNICLGLLPPSQVIGCFGFPRYILFASVTWTRVRVLVSDSGAGVRFVRIFGDTANNTWNPTRVSESDTGAGYPTRQKN